MPAKTELEDRRAAGCAARQNSAQRLKPHAVLLLGPTGAGKSPLGDWLERFSLWDRHWHHFDFGANLRAVVTGRHAGEFSTEEIQFLRRVLEAGALLEDEHFPLAARMLEVFLTQRAVGPSDLILLNGLPRHRQQARALDPKLIVIGVVHLECDAQTVGERLRRNIGGDRTQRADDSAALVERKLATYAERTQPLLDYYRERRVEILPVRVGVGTQPAEIVAQMKTWRIQR